MATAPASMMPRKLAMLDPLPSRSMATLACRKPLDAAFAIGEAVAVAALERRARTRRAAATQTRERKVGGACVERGDIGADDSELTPFGGGDDDVLGELAGGSRRGQRGLVDETCAAKVELVARRGLGLAVQLAAPEEAVVARVPGDIVLGWRSPAAIRALPGVRS